MYFLFVICRLFIPPEHPKPSFTAIMQCWTQPNCFVGRYTHLLLNLNLCKRTLGKIIAVDLLSSKTKSRRRKMLPAAASVMLFLRTKAKLFALLAMLLLSNDIHPHPGPSSASLEDSHRTKLCGTCDEPVNWDQMGIACDTCNQWFHANCQSVLDDSYERLCDPQVNASWYCRICNNPNYSSTIYDLFCQQPPAGQSLETGSHASICSLPEISLDSPDPSRHRLKPTHSSTPTRTKSQKSSKPLRIININFQSIKMKQCRISNLLESVKPDIILGTETWLDPSIKSSEIFPRGYSVFRKDRTKSGGGGVLIAVTSELICEEVPELDSNCEIIWAKIKLIGNGTLYLGSYYRRNVSDQESLVQLEASLSRIRNVKNANIVIGGDFNFPAWDWKTRGRRTLKPKAAYVDLHNQFAEMVDNHNLTQLVTEPTRIDNILDLVLVNCPCKAIRVEVIPGVSDHDAVFLELDMRPVTLCQNRRPIPIYEKAKWDNIRKDLSDVLVTLQDMYSSLNDCANTMWETFRDKLTGSVLKHIPHKIPKPRNGYPWINAELKKLYKKQHRLYKAMKKSGHPDVIAKYKSIKHLVQKRVRRAYWGHIDNLFAPKAGDNDYSGMKRFWAYVKHKRKDYSGVASLKVNGKLHTSPFEKGNILNAQFKSAFSSNEPVSLGDFQENQFMHDNLNPSSLDDITISSDGVFKLLSNLDPHKAAGPDNISPKVLAHLAKEIAPILTLIYNKSIQTGVVPTDWRNAHVAPIYKKGQKFLAENYRPISLTSVSCKVLEHSITSAIMTHAEVNNILYSNQHGFRKQRSCETQLIEFLEEVSTNLDEGKQTDVLIMDFAKAFDKVSHSLLTHKLQAYGITGKINQWIRNWLSNRSQSVIVEGNKSNPVSVDSGVPQGSVLGPSLFLYYINDIAHMLHSKIRLFADDTICYLVVNSMGDAQLLQDDLTKLGEWATKWRMEFHSDKCNVLTISNKRVPLQYTYMLNDRPLAHVKSAKYLGVKISHDLRWNAHIDSICTKANQTLGFLRRNVNLESVVIKERAYQTLVRPLLEFASVIWDPHTQTATKKIEMVQRRAARYVTSRSRNRSSVTDMLSGLKWRSLANRRKDARLSMFYKIVRGHVAVATSDLLKIPQRRTRHMHSDALQTIRCRTEMRKMSYYPRTIRDWNNLPASVVLCKTPAAFRAQVSALQ